MSEPKLIDQYKIRNIAIIAHVDHGKTTLVDAFLKQSNLFRENQDEMNQQQILDYGELERERGITIKAKNASIYYQDYKVNIIDTPGHADFGGEVERTLHMADGCLLLVDAQEGPMPQTKFVLRKAFELGLRPIVVINKIDKKHANPDKVLDKVHDLFLHLATNEGQLDFPVFYAIAREGKVYRTLPKALSQGNFPDATMEELLKEIIDYIPSPTGEKDQPAQMLISSMESNAHLGRFLIGRLNRGQLKIDQPVVVLNPSSTEKPREQGRIKKLFVREGLAWTEATMVSAGEIVAVAGIDTKAIGATLCSIDKEEALPQLKISDPSVRIKFEANTSPLVGKDGKFVTAKQLQQRLEKEIETNISLKIEKGDAGSYYVAGRGELQLSILIEELRREGYEFQIRRPEVLYQYRDDGITYEPLEELVIDVPEEYIGAVNAALGERNAQMENMVSENGQAQFTYKILTRNLFGLRSQLLTATKGNAVLNNFLFDYVPVTEQAELFRKGVLIASEAGTTMGYALNTIQERGDLFVGPGEEVYEGMILGINKYEQEPEVNATKQRQKSGVRMKHDEITQTQLRPLIPLTLEYALGFLAKDELLEVTPNHLRLRKVYLTKTERDWSKRDNLTDFAKKQMGIK